LFTGVAVGSASSSPALPMAREVEVRPLNQANPGKSVFPCAEPVELSRSVMRLSIDLLDDLG